MKVAIFGAGTMGSGIAQVFAAKGHTALMYASSTASAQRHKDNLSKSLQKRVDKGKMTQEVKDALMANILVEETDAAADADLVIECVKEDMSTKRALLKQLDPICKDGVIFASNTSSISLTALASATKRPSRVVGMHFFSPVPKMKLCEVIFGLLTEQEVLDDIKEVGERLGKTLILADDKPGFIVNRALLPMLNEACVVVGSFIGSVEDMDNGMKLGCNHPMGPLELADMVGLDILLNVMTVLAHEYGEKYHPSLLLRKMVTAGFLGRKSGAGFYLYENGKKAGVNPVLTQTHTLVEG